MDSDDKANEIPMDDFLISDLIKIIHKSYKHYLVHKLASLDITPGQIPFILELLHSKSLYQSDLTSKLLLSRAVTAKTLKKLDEKKIIKRKVAEDNKRKNEVYLTDKGKEIASEVEKIEKNWDKVLLKNFSKDFPNEDKKELKKILESLAKSSFNSVMEEREKSDLHGWGDYDDMQNFYKMHHSMAHPFKGHYFRGKRSRMNFLRKKRELDAKRFKKHWYIFNLFSIF